MILFFIIKTKLGSVKSLAKQTAIYGVSNMLAKFLNWLLVPLYTHVLTSTADYGVVTNLYAWVALLLVILTYGMETGFFRFANKEDADSGKVYGTVMLCVFSTSLIFAIGANVFSDSLAALLDYKGHSDWVAIMCTIIAIDAFSCIPFAHLRFRKQAGRFAMLKFVNVLVNIAANLFFLVLCPYLYKQNPDWVSWCFSPENMVSYVFWSNLISTVFILICLIPEMKFATGFDSKLLKKILAYSLPLLVLGIAGIMNQTLDKIIFRYLFDDKDFADGQVGIYGACFKISMVMMVFTQAFRYAYEPYVFAQSKESGDKKHEYALAMKFYFISSLLIFLGMVFYLDILKFVIHSSYWEGLAIVPVILLSYVFQGVYFNLSIWYKLIDKTYWGAVLSLIGLLITVVVNVLFVPTYSYYASAGASLVCFTVLTVVSYLLGQKYYKVDYDLKSLGLYLGVALLMYYVSTLIPKNNMVVYYIAVTVMLVAYLALLFKRDLPVKRVPVIGKFFR